MWRTGDGRSNTGACPGNFFLIAALIGRAACNIGFIERPLVIGFAWWLVTGEASPAVPLALFFELFWLDLFPIGSYAPPMPTFPYLLLLALGSLFGWTSPAALTFPLAVCLPLAYCQPLVEIRQRAGQIPAAVRLIEAAESMQPLGSLPGRLVLRSALEQIAAGLVLFLALYAACVLVVFSFRIPFGTPVLFVDIDWPGLYAVAAMGALLALRIRKIYLAFALCMAAVLLFKIF